MIKSAGGKLVTVFTHGAEVVVAWADPRGSDGDMLLSAEDARDLAAWITRAADVVDEEADE